MFGKWVGIGDVMCRGDYSLNYVINGNCENTIVVNFYFWIL